MATDGNRHPPRLFGTCPVPQSQYDRILLGHGSGGQLTADLIQRLFVPGFGNDVLAALEDQATLSASARRQRRQGAAHRLHHRFLRGPAAVLPRRRHRPAGGPRHGQRPGRRRRHAAVPVGGVHPRRGAAAGRPASASSPRCGRRAPRPAWRWSPATPRSWTAARATRSSSPPPASAWCPKGRSLSIHATRGPATAFSSRARSAITASPSCRCARGSSSRRSWKATAPR